MTRSAFRANRRQLKRRRLLESLEPRQLLASVSGEVWTDLDQNGVRGPIDVAAANISVYIDANDNLQLDPGEMFETTDINGQYSFASVPAGDHAFRLDLGALQTQVAPGGFIGTRAQAGGVTDVFEMDEQGNVATIGAPQSSGITGLIRTNSGTLFGINVTDDSLYTVDPVTGQETPFALFNFDAVAGLAYDSLNDQLFTMGLDGGFPNINQLYRINQTTGAATGLGLGVVGLPDVTDMTFDLNTETVVAFDNSDDEFIVFDIDGNVVSRTTALAPIDSFSLAHDGNEFLMFNNTDPARTALLSVDPTTGDVQPASLAASTGLVAESLHYSPIGDIAQRITVGTTDVTLGEFGILDLSLPNPTIATLGGLYINEILLDSVLGAPETQQYVEIRGDANELIPAGTYLVAVNDSNVAPGQVETVIDLSNIQLGNDGFLAILPENHMYQVNANATILESLTPGFGGLPGGIFSDISIADDLLPSGANTYFLVQSPVAPSPGDDIDANDDGFADPLGPIQNWTIEDSISIHSALAFTGQAYGDIVMLDDRFGLPFFFNRPPGAELVPVDGFGYAGRVGDSVGSLAADWVAGSNVQLTVASTAINLGPDTPVTAGVSNNTLATAQDLRDAIYSLDINPIIEDSSTNPHLTIDQTGSIGAFEYYRFNVVTPTSDIVLDIDNANFNSELHLYDITGRLLASSDDNPEPGEPQGLNPRISMQVTGGSYIVGVAGNGSFGATNGITGEPVPAGGTYDLHISVEPSPATNINVPAFTGSFTLGTPSQLAFSGRRMDHLGDSNFVGGARGTVLMEPPATMPGGPNAPAPNVTVFTDTNDNGRIDSLEFFADPDPFDIEDVLRNSFEGVTLNAALNDNSVSDFPVTAQRDRGSLTGGRVYGFDEEEAYFNETVKFRADFYRPVNRVSIDAVAGEGLIPTYGRLEVYDANDNLLQTVLSPPLLGNNRFQLGIDLGADVIAYAIAYSDETVLNEFGLPIFTSDLGRFDNLSFRQLEESDVTDANGFFELTHLIPDTYKVTFLNDAANQPLVGAEAFPIEVETYENYVIGQNTPPVTTDFFLTADENLPLDSIIGTVTGVDFGGPVSFSIETAANFGIQIGSNTGVLSVGPGAVLDFESTPIITLDVGVTDLLGATSISRVEIALNDINEAPTVNVLPISFPEDIANGGTAGQVTATDPDTNQNQTLTYSVIGGSAQGFLAIDPNNGVITVTDSSQIDFETANMLDLEIEVADDGLPNESTVFTQPIEILDANDAPVIQTTAFTVPENLVGQIGRIITTNQDAGQTLQYLITGGTAAGLVQIDSNGFVTLNPSAQLDFESNNALTLGVTVIDSGSPPLDDSQDITINVTDIDEPASLAFDSLDVAENSDPTAVLTTLVLNDPEGRPEDSEISLVQTGDFASFDFDPATLELSLATGVTLDFESTNFYGLEFLITDTTGQTASVQVPFSVNVTDANDPPVLLEERLAVSEAAQPGDQIGTLRISDPDVGQTVTATIVGGTGQSVFALDPLTHVLTLADGATIDADTLGQDHFTLDVQLSDGAGGDVNASTIVLVNDVNESPFFDPNLEIPKAFSGVPFVLTIPDEAITDPENRDIELAVFNESGVLPSWLSFDPSTRTLSGLPTPELVGSENLTIHAFELGPPDLFNSLPFELVVELGDNPYTNTGNRFDVDANGRVAARDALLILNFMGRNGVGAVAENLDVFTGFVDVNLDSRVTALDAIQVINALTQQQFIPEAELPSFEISDREEAVDLALAELESSLF